MGCQPISSPDGAVRGVVCTRGPRHGGRRCGWCSALARRLCDGVIDGRSCDAPCCTAHTTRVSAGRDLCPDCARVEALAADLDAAESVSGGALTAHTSEPS